MKTKAEVVQALLDERKITAEDAVILLTPDPKQITDQLHTAVQLR